MTSFIAALPAILAGALVAGSAFAAEPAAKLSSAPAGTRLGSAPHYQQGPGSTLAFTFDQAGAASQGSFRDFKTDLAYDEKDLASSSLSVRVQIASLDTQDADRDSTLKGADLFDAQKFPDATFTSGALVRDTSGKLEAAGKLTLRGITHNLRIPLAIKPTATGLELTGETSIKRLDYGIGQGEWKSTEWVGDIVKLSYKVALVKAAGG